MNKLIEELEFSYSDTFVEVSGATKIAFILFGEALLVGTTIEITINQAKDVSGTGTKLLRKVSFVPTEKDVANGVAYVEVYGDELDTNNEFNCIQAVSTALPNSLVIKGGLRYSNPVS